MGLGGERGLLTWIHPLHAVGEGLVCDEVVASRAGVGNDYVGLGEVCPDQEWEEDALEGEEGFR